MEIPQILKESIACLQGIVDNVDELCILNVLNAKMAHLVSLKGCLFRQYTNSNPRTLSYYCMAFMHSGMNKDNLVDSINNYLLSFVGEEIENSIEVYKTMLEVDLDKAYSKKEREKKEKELEAVRVANWELASPNYTGLYKEAQQIHKIHFGSIFIRMGELGDYVDNIASGDKSKKELYQKLKDIFEGTFYPSVIAGDSTRETLYNVPVQTYLYTDFENLYNEKNKEIYLNSLKTGMARRSFIYMPCEKKELVYPTPPEFKDNAFLQARSLQEEFKRIFKQIPTNHVYELTEEAKQRLYEYQCECIDFFNSSDDNLIIKLENKESFWKITKLAVVYSIIDNPKIDYVQLKYVEMAIDFYQKIKVGLRNVINQRKESEIDKFISYLYKNKKNVISKMDLRNLNIVPSNKFKQFWDCHFEEIKEGVELTYKLQLVDYTGKGNTKGYQLIQNG